MQYQGYNASVGSRLMQNVRINIPRSQYGRFKYIQGFIKITKHQSMIAKFEKGTQVSFFSVFLVNNRSVCRIHIIICSFFLKLGQNTEVKYPMRYRERGRFGTVNFFFNTVRFLVRTISFYRKEKIGRAQVSHILENVFHTLEAIMISVVAHKYIPTKY